MNCFSTFSGMRETSNFVNSLTNRFAKPLTFDFSGTNYTDLSATSSYHTSAAGLNPNSAIGNTSFAIVKYNNRPLVVSDFSSGSFTFYLKHASNNSTLPPFNFLYPNMIKLSTTSTSVGQDFSAQFYSFLNPGTIIDYSISGLVSSNLNGASISGTFTAPFQEIAYSVSIEPTSPVFFNVSGGLSTYLGIVHVPSWQTVFQLDGSTSLNNTISNDISGVYYLSGTAQSTGTTNVSPSGYQFTGSNYTIYGNAQSQFPFFGTNQFKISIVIQTGSTINDNTSQFIVCTGLSSSVHPAFRLMILFGKLEARVIVSSPENSGGARTAGGVVTTSNISANTTYVIEMTRGTSSFFTGTIKKDDATIVQTSDDTDYYYMNTVRPPGTTPDIGNRPLRLGGQGSGSTSVTSTNYPGWGFSGNIKSLKIDNFL